MTRFARLDLLDPLEVARLGGIEVTTEDVVEGFLSGLHRSPRRGFSVEFAEHRMYQPGDELRYVDWKILGRNDRLYVKQYEEETNLRAMAVLDVSRSMAWTGAPETVLPKLDYARRLVAALSLVLLRQRDATGLIAFDDEVRHLVPPRARLSHWRQLVQTLAGLRAGQGTAAEPALRRVVDQLRRRGLVVFVSDLLLDRALALTALRFLRHRGHQVLVLHVLDPAELELAGPAEARFEDPETREGVVLRPRDWAAAYHETLRQVIGDWRLACRRHGIHYHQVITTTPFGTVLREALAPGPGYPRGMIGFLHPWALAGLAAAAIPVLLHLLARREPPTVVFPAVRYLITTTREHQRRLKLQNLLLLLLRTLLLVALVLAAAGPTLPLRGVPGHAPGALVVIVDNSPSSGAMVAGSPRLAQLRTAAREVLARATPEDAVWLITAEGIPQRGDSRALADQVSALAVFPRRLDLGAAITAADEVLAPETRPGGIVLLTDLQASAVTPAQPRVPLVVGRPSDPPPPNAGIARLTTGAQPWSGDGGRITVSLAGDSGAAIPLVARLDSRPQRQALARVGGAATLALPAAPSGWWTVSAELGPDELRADDRRIGAVRVAAVAGVSCPAAERYVAAACGVLESNRRITRGDEITLGRLGPRGSVIEPPADAAALGALNRALAARGVAWRYGALSLAPTSTDSGPAVGRVRVLRRYRLESSASGRSGVIATAGGEPWLVRSGDVVLLGSRLDPAWTELPVSAGFMPFMDLLLNRLARGEVSLGEGAPGDPVPVPDLVTSVRQGEREWRVEGGGSFRPADVGAYYLLAGRDTLGAISANLDPRETLLRPAPDAQVRRLWRGTRVIDLPEAAGLAFASGALGDLRGPFLWLAAALGLGEMALATGRRRKR